MTLAPSVEECLAISEIFSGLFVRLTIVMPVVRALAVPTTASIKAMAAAKPKMKVLARLVRTATAPSRIHPTGTPIVVHRNTLRDGPRSPGQGVEIPRRIARRDETRR